MPGLSAPLPLTRPAGEASGGLPPAASQACRPSGGCFPSPEGPAEASPAEAPHAASTFFRVVGSLGKTEDRQSPRGPTRGGDGQDRSALLCPALPCEQDRATEGAGGPVRGLTIPWNYRNRFLHATSDLFLEDFMSDALLGDSGSAVNFILTTMHVSEGGRE